MKYLVLDPFRPVAPTPDRSGDRVAAVDRQDRAADEVGFGTRFRAAFLQRRRDALAVILDRARERGDLPPHPTPAVALDLVFGTIWYRVLATRGRLDKTLVDDLVGMLAGA